MQSKLTYGWTNGSYGERLVTFMLILAVVVSGAAALVPIPAHAAGNIEELHEHAEDVDNRAGSIAPTAAQKAAVPSGATVRWNKFGTPQSLVVYGGYLGAASGSSARAAAFDWIGANSAIFGLSNVSANTLEFVNDSPIVGTDGHAVVFRQRYGDGIAATHDGMVTVGLEGSSASGWKVAYASSSLTREQSLDSTSFSLTAQQAWVKAAQYNGLDVTLSSITSEAEDKLANGEIKSDWRILTVSGLSHPQRARQVALPVIENGAAAVRPAYETIVLDIEENGHTEAYTTFVDAVTGEVWLRLNNVQQLAQSALSAAPVSGAFTGTVTQSLCGPDHSFVVPEGQKSIALVATADVAANDIILKLKFGGDAVASSDTLTSPEAILYEPAGGVPAGTYAAQVCPFPNGIVVEPATYTGSYATSETSTSAFPYPPKWKYFTANPNITGDRSADTRIIGCWQKMIEGVSIADCVREEKNLASRVPWDHSVQTNTPTFTTFGNNVFSAEAWTGPNTVQFGNITPGTYGYMPRDLDREYAFPWQNRWNTVKCDPAELAVAPYLAPNANDISSAATNLFVEHNRVHDWSYSLGFTEQNYNLQVNNFGNTAPGPYPSGREGDPEVGDVQVGAVTGGAPTYGGRDNANQITLNDGIAPITNMYLWQPIAAAFYSPCVDGDFDMSVIAHEYGHAIQNRMVAGPDSGLSGHQARAMGESWSDLTAVEYLAEFGYSQGDGVNPFAVGPYVTGSLQKGIRNYGMNSSPLNYSDLDYDPNGVTSPHADGEIWSATNYDIRQLLVEKYNGSFPASDATLQRRCAEGEVPADQCPGNRRWAQIYHDAFLLMPSAVSMVDARDAYLAADVMRFGGANQTELWRAFARRGLGTSAVSNTNGDRDPQPSFESPQESNATATFKVLAADEGRAAVSANIYVGRYEARAVPVADTNDGTPLSNSTRFAAGTYEFVAQAPGYGAFRFTRTFSAGRNYNVTVSMPTNWASQSQGATAGGDGINQSKLIDDTEATNWARLGAPVQGSQVTVDLAGGSHKVTRVQVSALLRPANAKDAGGDTGSQSRFSALRQFEIWTCTASSSNGGCGDDGAFTKAYTSAADAFPSDVPRPLAPDHIIRNFDIPDVTATHVQLRVVSNQCTGAPAYQGELDNDVTNPTDCDAPRPGSLVGPQAGNVRAAELQVFSSNGGIK